MTQSLPLDKPWCLTWRFWLTLWAVVAVVQAALLMNGAALDSHAYRTVRWFFGTQEKFQPESYLAATATQPGDKSFYQTSSSPLGGKVYKRTDTWWEVFKALGETFFIVLAAIAMGLYHRRNWWAALSIAAATAAAGALSTLVRATAGRYRPVAPQAGDAESTWFFFRGLTGDGANLSWPSGHATAAFALAAALAYLSPRGRWLFLVIAAGTAASRVVMLAHFPADAIFGAALGFTIGWLVTEWLSRVADRREGLRV